MNPIIGPGFLNQVPTLVAEGSYHLDERKEIRCDPISYIRWKCSVARDV